MYSRRLIFLLTSFLVCVATLSVSAQQPDSSRRPQLARAMAARPYRVLGSDSVALFYTADYELCPPGCATIRRHARLDSTGMFFGFVRDYWMHTAQPALTGAYKNGKKEGVFEVFHPNGEVATRAYYRGGQPVGNWAYWYPSGQKRQILSFGTGEALLIQQFWAEDGQQLVRDGQGSWYRTDAGLRVEGSVLNGLPTGRWRVREATGRQSIRAEELFLKGRFRAGITRPTGDSYYDQSRIYITDLDSYSEAERFLLRPVCPPDSAAGAK
ncbi:hypothetical protein GCM10011378_14410 [Hymenobacter glacieicola]|uniref:MORN repeat variant n=2 Tax=Hymenobacter glacieicola TaxID=1562124 RepID=A0ABQ1WNT9_9BACT|nr:hypothetical protein GCM10011378_14410 [Hymenobacter glacieicola]